MLKILNEEGKRDDESSWLKAFHQGQLLIILRYNIFNCIQNMFLELKLKPNNFKKIFVN